MATYDSWLTLTRLQANSGFYMPSTGAPSRPFSVHVNFYTRGLPSLSGGIGSMIMPGSIGPASESADASGEYFDSVTYYPEYPVLPLRATRFWQLGNEQVLIPKGLLASQYRILLSGPNISDSSELDIQFHVTVLDAPIYTAGPPPEPVTNLRIKEAKWNGEVQEITVDWENPIAAPGEEPEQIIINVETIPPVEPPIIIVVPPETTEATFPIYPPLPETIEITVQPVTIEPPTSAPIAGPVITPLPVNIFGFDAGVTGGISLGGTAALQIIADPSGIYTLVPGSTHDVLYERLTGIASQNIKIPRPFAKTHFFGK